jgi:IMP and pyridine-specific 5'-nucleotidase
MTNETDSKYAVSQRKHICPSFNELRHILNLSQVISIGQNLSLISFDGDQTLYSDGGNFENNMELAFLIICLLKARV